MIINGKSALDYAKMGSDTLIRKFSVGDLPPKDRFHYHQGVFLSGMERTYFLSGDKKYYNYIKDWIDHYVDDDGKLRYMEKHEPQFDDMQPAILLYHLYEVTKDERYRKTLDNFVPVIDMWPCNAKGGYWHKFFRKNEMWLDTLYMIGPLAVMYSHHFNTKPYFFEKVYTQMNLMRRNMTDPKTGLLYHAWDDSKEVEWSNKETGLSEEFWGRAIGWYAVAIMDILDYLPENHKRMHEFISAGYDIINALLRFQDEKTGMWYQVVDKGSHKGNWIETSCTSLYTYAIAKAMKKGLLSRDHARHIHRSYEGVIKSLAFEGDDLILSNVCVGTGVGNLQFYLDRPTVQNDLHGMGAFLLMCTEYHDTCKKLELE